jgi:phosphatidylethanolamine-binding protein (PEBP) family uncharacterized protein
MKSLRILVGLLLVFAPQSSEAVTSKTVAFTAEVWADNWFALYINGKKIGEDSIPITTQKSFNSETIKFVAAYPLTIGFIAKDYVQSKSGLEYLGTPNQQIGDGGIKFQIRETASNKLVAVSDSTWKAKVANTAPLNPECEKSTQPDIDCKFLNTAIPSTWYSSSFIDKSWNSAKVFTSDEVGPKDGYFSINWESSAQFIWGNDLKLDNIVYLRKKVSVASSAVIVNNFDFKVTSSTNNLLSKDVTCDGLSKSPGLAWTSLPSTAKSLILIMDTIPGPARPGETQTGNHYYISKFNISPSLNGFKEGAITPYSPPCSQGPGVKEYRFFLFALDKVLPADQKSDGAILMEIGESQAIAKATHIYAYSRSAK